MLDGEKITGPAWRAAVIVLATIILAMAPLRGASAQQAAAASPKVHELATGHSRPSGQGGLDRRRGTVRGVATHRGSGSVGGASGSRNRTLDRATTRSYAEAGKCSDGGAGISTLRTGPGSYQEEPKVR